MDDREKNCSQKDHSKKDDFEKYQSEDTSPNRNESVSINIEDIPEYQKKGYNKQERLGKEMEMTEKKWDREKKNNSSFQKNYFVYTVGDDGDGVFEYDDPKSRNGFVAKVFLILFVMLICNGIIVTVIKAWKPLNDALSTYTSIGILKLLVFIFVFVFLGIICGLIYYPYMKKPPCIWINLVLVFIDMTLNMVLISVLYGTILIIVAVAATAIVVFICVLLALTRIDFTEWMTLAIILLLACFAIFGFQLVLVLCGVRIEPLEMVLVGICCLVTIFIFIIELQMLLGGRSEEFAVNNYALPALCIYMSIVMIFLNFVNMLNMVLDSDADDDDDDDQF